MVCSYFMKKLKIALFLFCCICTTSASKAADMNIGQGMNIKIGAEYVGINSIESKYLAYTKIKEAEKTLYRLKQSTNTFEYVRKTTAEQREDIDKRIKELEAMLASVNEDNVTDKEYVKIQVKLQNIIDEMDMIDNIIDYTYGFVAKFMLNTGILASSRYVFVTPLIADVDVYYQLNKFANPFIGMRFSVPILANRRDEMLTSGYDTLTYAILLEARFGNLFKFHKNHYISLFCKLGGFLGHQSDEVQDGSHWLISEKEKIKCYNWFRS